MTPKTMTTKKLPATQRESTEYKVGNKKPPKEYQWKKGQSGNPKGYKPPKSLVEFNALLDEIFAETIERKNPVTQKVTRIEKLRVALNNLLLNKSPAGAIHILDRRFGKVTERVDLTSGDEPLKPPQIIEVIRTYEKETDE